MPAYYAGKVLEINGGSDPAKNGTAQIYLYHNGSNQKWNLIPKQINKQFSSQNINSLKQDFNTLLGSGIRRPGCHYTPSQCLDIILKYDDIITAYCNDYNIPKEMVQTILMQELWCVGADDDLADSIVNDFYRYQHELELWLENPLIYPEPTPPINPKYDSSTGLGQITGVTAIKANNSAVSRNIPLNSGEIYSQKDNPTDNDLYLDWKDREKIWLKLKNDDNYNILMVAQVLLFEAYKSNMPYDYWNYSPEDYKLLFTKYNASSATKPTTYGKECYSYFEIFKKYNS